MKPIHDVYERYAADVYRFSLSTTSAWPGGCASGVEALARRAAGWLAAPIPTNRFILGVPGVLRGETACRKAERVWMWLLSNAASHLRENARVR
jgi:hypothetical protein